MPPSPQGPAQAKSLEIIQIEALLHVGAAILTNGVLSALPNGPTAPDPTGAAATTAAEITEAVACHKDFYTWLVGAINSTDGSWATVVLPSPTPPAPKPAPTPTPTAPAPTPASLAAVQALLQQVLTAGS